MSIVQLWLQTAAQTAILDTVDEARIKAHSQRVDAALQQITNNTTPVKEIVLHGAAPAALKYILERIKNNSTDKTLHIKVHGMPLAKAVAVYEATEVLQLQPDQPHIEGHIVGYISHNQVTPAEMMSVGRCFYGRDNRTWRVLTQQIAWDITHGKYSEEAAGALQTEAFKWRLLSEAIGGRVDELVAKKTEREKQKADRKERLWQVKASRSAMKGHQADSERS